MLTEDEIERIASSTHILRPDWPVASLRTVLKRRELAAKTRRDVIVALGWVAAESASLTPARVIEAGPWWQAAAVESSNVVRFPPKRGEDCPRHPGEWPDTCRGCASERLAPDEPGGSYTRPTPVDASHVRAALRLATAGLCAHGVEPDHCHEAHDQECGQ